MEDIICNMLCLVFPFSALGFALYILYLVVLNNFTESRRNFYRDSVVTLSEEGREWTRLMVEVEKETRVKAPPPPPSFNPSSLMSLLNVAISALGDLKPRDIFPPPPSPPSYTSAAPPKPTENVKVSNVTRSNDPPLV